MTYRPSDTYTICSDVLDWIDSVATGQVKFVPALPLIAEFIPAYIPNHLIVISGYTSAGKSQLISQIVCDSASVHKAPTLVVSVEDSRLEKMMSIISVLSGIHKRNMLMGTVSEAQLNVVTDSMGLINEWPLYIYDDVYTLVEIEGLIMDLKPKIVIIDYIQNLKLQGGNIYERISGATPKLFEMANNYGVTMFVASQIDNQSAKEESEGFIASKGAGELVAAAHVVLHLKKGRVEGKLDKIEIHVKKNKAFGSCGKILGAFNKHWTAIEKEEEIHQMHGDKLARRGKQDE